MHWLPVMTIYQLFLFCRNCGRVFCGSCCDDMTPVPSEQYYDPVRVCKTCFEKLHVKNSQDITVAASWTNHTHSVCKNKTHITKDDKCALFKQQVVDGVHCSTKEMLTFIRARKLNSWAYRILTEILKVGQILLESWAFLHLSGGKVHEDWSKTYS